ncbi:MAG: TIGR00282 family metallophosphoesterase [Ruminococcus sp.]|nr:TIGR00282 family metallophosphoesterase [Ruminococcus sp.]
MNLLFIGDVVGQSGCDFLGQQLYKLKKEYDIDLTVVNGENSATGNGITPDSFEQLIRMGVDVVTTGNHCFRRKEIVSLYDNNDILLRPANYPDGVNGKGFVVLDLCPVKVAIVNLMGTVYLDSLDNPFVCIDRVLEQIDTPNIIVDFHAEATSEKKAMGFYLQGRATAVIGTHTHVQTADETILGGHTAYITDAGMVGPELSVLGVDSDLIIKKLKYHTPVKHTESSNPPFLNGVVISFDEKLGKSTNITRIISRK